MKGKNEFTEIEIENLKNLISEKIIAAPDKQKGIRNKIRNLGFYYSDFSTQKNGYDLNDLQKLIDNHEIKIIENNNYKSKKIRTTRIETKTIAKPKLELINPTDLALILEKFSVNRFDPILDNENKIDNCCGNYIICKRPQIDLPDFFNSIEFKKFDNLEVIYTGIAGKSLKTRDFKQHFKGNNAGRSTLRKSLGVLFGYKLIARDKDPNTGKTKFCTENEIELSEWMNKNLVMYFLPNADYDNLEKTLIEYFNPPLNLSKNKNIINLTFRKKLSELRNTRE